MSREIKGILKCDTDPYNFELEFITNIENNDTIFEKERKIIDSLFFDIRDYFEYVVDDSIYEILINPEVTGVFDIYEIMDNTYASALKQLKNELKDIHIWVEELNNDKSVSTIYDVNVMYIIEQIVEGRSESEQSCCDAGMYIEKSLELFVEEGIWNFGFIDNSNDNSFIDIDSDTWPTPLIENNRIIWTLNDSVYSPYIWFGIKGEAPIPEWSINDAKNNISFWYSDSCDSLAYITDDNVAFLTWYCFECAMSFPNLSEIISRCPIRITEDDSDEEILKRSNEYLYNEYMKNHSK